MDSKFRYENCSPSTKFDHTCKKLRPNRSRSAIFDHARGKPNVITPIGNSGRLSEPNWNFATTEDPGTSIFINSIRDISSIYNEESELLTDGEVLYLHANPKKDVA